MNILILNWKDIKNPEVGGAEVIAFELAERLVGEGHTVTFFCRKFVNSPEQETIHGINIVRRGNKITVYPHAYFYYKSLMQKPDLVIDMINTLCWQTPLYVPKEKRIAYINQLAKEVLFYEFPFPLSFISYFLERFEYASYKQTRFICYSASTKKDLATFGIKEKNISLFSLGIDHGRYKIGGKKSETPLFLFVARLVKMKRADKCIKAMELVVRKYPEAKLLIVGNGPEENSLQNLVKRLGLSKNVTLVNKNNFFYKKVVKDIKVKLMQEAWALLLPSVKEGWGMVVTEAAACGTPSIVSDVTGLRDSVRDKKTGIILSKNPKPDEIADVLIKMIENKDYRTKLSKNSIAWAKNFTWENTYKEFKKCIKS